MPPQPARSVTLDALRGAALAGILSLHTVEFANPDGPPGLGFAGPTLDRLVYTALIWLVESKFFSLFSLLFGVGFAVQLGRPGPGFGGRYARRLAALAAFGIAHVVFLWEGDILLVYALVGALLPLFRGRSDRGLIRWATGLLLIPAIVYALVFAGVVAFRLTSTGAATLAEADAELLTELARIGEVRQATVVAGQTSYLDDMPKRINDYTTTSILLLTRVPTVLAMFLVGFAAGRRGVLTDPAAHWPLLRRVCVRVGGAGLVAAALVTLVYSTTPPITALCGLFFNQALAGPLLGIGYAAAGALAVNRVGPAAVGPLAAVGRLGLTNYLTQSLILDTLFAPWGCGLVGRVRPIEAIGLAALIFTVQMLASAALQLVCDENGVQSPEFDAGVGGGELPVRRDPGRVPVPLPRRHLGRQRRPVRDAPVQALPAEDRQLDLGHVQPTPVLWCEVPLDPVGQPPGLPGRERLVQRPGPMRVQVVGHQHHLLGVRVRLVQQALQEVREVDGRPPVGHFDHPPAGERLERHEQVRGPVTGVLRVLLGGTARPDRQRRPDIPDQLFAGLVHAHHRPPRVGRPVVHRNHVLHRGDERPGRRRRDDPLPLEPRLDLVFWSVRQTVAGSIDGTTSSSTSRSASSRMVHRARPTGGSDQAMATSAASCAPSSLRYCRPVGFFRCRVASSPSRANCWRTRWTVIRDTSRASAMRSSGHPSGPSASALSRIRARVRAAAGYSPVRVSRSRAARSSADRRMTILVAGDIATPPGATEEL